MAEKENRQFQNVVLETYPADTTGSETNEHICARLDDVNVFNRSNDDQAKFTFRSHHALNRMPGEKYSAGRFGGKRTLGPRMRWMVR